MQRRAAATLPLFPEGETGARKSRSHEMTPSELALHTYWSASVEAQALGAAAMNAAAPSHRTALLELKQAEVERRETARRLLERVWGIKIAAGGAAAA